MKDLSDTIQKALESQLNLRGYDVVDLVALPKNSDKMVRLQNLEEALNEFDSNKGEAVSYLIQVKLRPEVEEARPKLDGIYLSNGKINVPFLWKNGELLFIAREYALAKNVFRTILQSGERSAQALFWIGRCWEAEGKFDEAQRSYEESIAYYPTLESFQHFAALLIRARKDQQAAELLERTLEMKGLESAARHELHLACGNCWSRIGQLDRALDHYRRATDQQPDSNAAWAALGAMALEKKSYADAKKYFQKALALNVKCDKALSGLASVFLAEGEKRLAHDYFAKALDLNLQNPTAIYHLVKCAYEIKSYATAARILEEYIQSAPVNANLMYSLAGLQFHLGRIDESLDTANRIIELQPQHTGAQELKKRIEAVQ